MKLESQVVFIPEEAKYVDRESLLKIIKYAMGYQQAHDYQLAGQQEPMDAALLDSLVDEKELEIAFKEVIDDLENQI
jgi:hypothetical protein